MLPDGWREGPAGGWSVPMATAAEGSVGSPCDPRWAGLRLRPSLLLGVGRNATVVRRSAPPVPWLPGPRESLTRGVGSRRVASVSVRPACPRTGVDRVAVAFTAEWESAAVGVDSRWPASRARLGRRATPADGLRLEP